MFPLLNKKTRLGSNGDKGSEQGIRRHGFLMDELRKNTIIIAISIATALLMLAICTAGTSTLTSFVIIGGISAIAFFSIIGYGRTRYLIALVFAGLILLTLVFDRDFPGGMPGFLRISSVLIRFLATALFIGYFGKRLSLASQKLYTDMKSFASIKDAALSESRKTIERINALVAVITSISRKTSLDEIFKTGLEESRKALRADSGLIYRAERDGRLTIVESFGYEEETLQKMSKKRITTESCPACKRLEPEVVDDLSSLAKCHNLSTTRTGSSICLPIVSGSRLWGAMHLRRKQPESFNAGDIQLASAIAYQFAIAMQRAELFEEISMLAVTDPLTSIFNYRRLVADLEMEIMRSKRYGRHFSFLMADIDHFKDFNDKYGHQAGDQLLRTVARTLVNTCRKTDRVYRYGGEEFSILLPETELEPAMTVAEKIRERVARETGKAGNLVPEGATISIGVASFPEDATNMRSLISCADTALYRAKSRGRNRVVAYRDVPTENRDGFSESPVFPRQEDPSASPSE